MPELPEVETLKRQLQKVVKGKVVKSSECNWSKMVKPYSVLEFQKLIKNKKIKSISRLSKVLVLDLEGPLSLAIHLKLTGQLIFRPQKGKAVFGGHPQKGGLEDLPNKFTHLILNFSDGSILYFNDLRKFGWARLIDDQGVAQIVMEHGPEPLSKEFNLNYFQSIVKKYPNRFIKLILLDQKLIGGIGNIYCDESCFCAGILPMRLAASLEPIEIKKLYECINKIIDLAISKKGTSADTYVTLTGKPGGMVPFLKVYGRKGKKCRRCGEEIRRIKLNGRGTHYCSECQK